MVCENVHGFVVSFKCITTHAETTPGNISALTGLSAVLGIVLVALMLAVCILFISLMKIKLQNKNLSPTTEGTLVWLLCKTFVQFHLSKNKIHHVLLWKSNVFPTIGSQAAMATTNPTYYEQVELQTPITSTAAGEEIIYEQVDLKPIATQQREIEVAPNAAYVTVQR